MEKEDVVRLLELASRSRVHSALVGILMMIIGVIFVSLGSHAIELEIVVGGILMIVLGSHAIITKGIRDIRGLGLMVGLELDAPAAPVAAKLREAGLLCIPTGQSVLRFVPPLVVTEAEVSQALAILDAAL